MIVNSRRDTSTNDFFTYRAGYVFTYFSDSSKMKIARELGKIIFHIERMNIFQQNSEKSEPEMLLKISYIDKRETMSIS